MMSWEMQEKIMKNTEFFKAIFIVLSLVKILT